MEPANYVFTQPGPVEADGLTRRNKLLTAIWQRLSVQCMSVAVTASCNIFDTTVFVFLGGIELTFGQQRLPPSLAPPLWPMSLEIFAHQRKDLLRTKTCFASPGSQVGEQMDPGRKPMVNRTDLSEFVALVHKIVQAGGPRVSSAARR
eukprot:2807412-Amphidinium_carterae.1